MFVTTLKWTPLPNPLRISVNAFRVSEKGYTARTDDGHAPPLSLSGKTISLTFILLSPLVRFLALSRIKPQPPPLVCSPANSLKYTANPHFLSVNAFFAEALAPGKKGFVSALRPYSPGGPLNGFPTTLESPVRTPRSSGHRLRPGLRGFSGSLSVNAFCVAKRVLSNPLCSPGFRPSPSDPFQPSAFCGTLPLTLFALEGSRHRWSSRDYKIVIPSPFERNLPLLGKGFLPLPLEYPRPLPVPSPAVSPTSPAVICGISLGTCWTGYERFKPNNRGHHSGRGYYRGGWHPSCPPLIRQAVYTWQKPPAGAEGTLNPSVTLARIAEVSRLLHPVGPGFLSQNPSPGSLSQGPYRLSPCQDVTLATS